MRLSELPIKMWSVIKILRNLLTGRQKYSMKSVIWPFADTAVFFQNCSLHYASIFRNKSNIIFSSSSFSWISFMATDITIQKVKPPIILT